MWVHCWGWRWSSSQVRWVFSEFMYQQHLVIWMWKIPTLMDMNLILPCFGLNIIGYQLHNTWCTTMVLRRKSLYKHTNCQANRRQGYWDFALSLAQCSFVCDNRLLLVVCYYYHSSRREQIVDPRGGLDTRRVCGHMEKVSVPRAKWTLLCLLGSSP